MKKLAFLYKVCTKLDFEQLFLSAKCLSPRKEANKIYLCFCFFAFLFCHIINILLTELGRSVWENLDLGRYYRPHCVRCVLATSVIILP